MKKEVSEKSENLAKKIRKLEIRTDWLVRNLIGGQYLSVFKGRGLEFTEVREYEEGDDVRLIDWNVTARMDRLFVKKFVEERELTLFLAVDISASLGFGSGDQLKKELAAEFAAAIALSALRNHDQVGLLLFSDRVEKFLPPQRGKTHVLRLIRDLLTNEPLGIKTDYEKACKHLQHFLKRRSAIFFLSDFLDESFEAPFKALGTRHDIIAVTLADPREKELPDVGRVQLTDPESGKNLIANTGDPSVRENYRLAYEKNKQSRNRILRGMGVDELVLTTGESYVAPLMRFFLSREKRRLKRHR
ncbi:MAG TPA: DUF58 domain-containing protein [Cyanobacteria bacterium UBA8530]|nr:DUF58 domain-containing protein [Cyanobacteria bacterium UBA8530]